MPLLRIPFTTLLLFALTAAPGIDAGAAEGGKSLYLPGKRGPLAGLIPKPSSYVTIDV